MNKSIIFFDVTTKLINPKDEVFIDKKLVEIFIDYDKSIDKILTNIINENLVIEEYTNIILPACFGKVLADFLGLRFAAHIRCTPGINQHKNIFLYSFNGIKDYFSSESFNILKTEGVFLIDYDVNTIINKSLDKIEYLSKEKIINEVKKINLQIPANYEDNHSIANEWAIYRWSQAINASDDSIDKITNIQNSNLYFKYLRTIYPMSKVDIIEDSELKLNFEGNPTILYIDDEADKGWKEIFETLFYEKNENIVFFHLDNELNDKTKKEISELTIKTIKEKNVDVVILDFRLHKDDFECKKIEEVTGYQILKKIKDHNKGIQVIIFSATNKIWNFQALQEAGADGFILKESPENSIDFNFTKQSIASLVKTIENRLNMVFLKKVYPIIENIKKHLINISNDNGGNGLEEGLMKMKFKNEIFIQLDIIYDCLEKSSLKISTIVEDEHSYLNLSFISIFKIIELINDFFTDEKGIILKSKNVNVQRYNQNSDTFSQFTGSYPLTRDKIYSIIKFELNDEPKKHVNKLNEYINFRNNIIHPKTLKEYKKTTKEENLKFIQLIEVLILKIN